MINRIETVSFRTGGPGFTDITGAVEQALARIGAGTGLVTLFVRHTSASLTIQENADPDVLADLADALDAIAPRGRSWRHRSEGPDDMPAHVRAMVTSTSLSVPVRGGAMMLGIWQAVYLVEHRDTGRLREIAIHYAGEPRSVGGSA